MAWIYIFLISFDNSNAQPELLFQTLNLCLYEIVSVYALFDTKSLWSRMQHPIITQIPWVRPDLGFSMRFSEMYCSDSQVWLGILYLSITSNALKRSTQKRPVSQIDIAQVRRNDFFAILSLLMHEQFLFLHLLRSYTSQDSVKRWKPDQSFEQEEFNIKHS